MLCITPCFPVDGIAVSAQTSVYVPGSNGETPNGGDIFRYDIGNNNVTRTTRIFDGGGGDASKAKSRARFPAINIEGTKIAFYRITSDSGSFVSVMNMDGTGRRDLAKIPGQSGYDGRGYLGWVRQGADEWIYYIMAGMNSAHAGNKLLWRVNAANPSRNEQVVFFQWYLWQWELSWNGERAILRPSENQAGCPGMVGYIMPGNGAFNPALATGGGCAAGLSPSGRYIMYLNGGAHTDIHFDEWDASNQIIHLPGWFNIYDGTAINPWVANPSPNLTTYCPTRAVGEITVGLGTACNRWSCNSDKWLCLCMGWPDIGSGRYMLCGGNQVLCNWMDSITIMTSNSPRTCGDSTTAAVCDKNSTIVGVHHYENDAGDFWCSTIADINEDLRSYIGVNEIGANRTTPGHSLRNRAEDTFYSVRGTRMRSLSNVGVYITRDSRVRVNMSVELAGSTRR